MKSYTRYINEDASSKWMDCVKKMYKWYCDNYEDFYDTNHLFADRNYKKCELIDNKKTVADCSGFVAACLCLAGYINDPTKMNTRLGSFNHYKNSNYENDINNIIDTLNKETVNKIKKDLLYIADIPDFKCVKLSDEKKKNKDLSEIHAGDILVKGSHVTIAATDGATKLYDWGKTACMGRHLSEKKNYDPIDFYVPKDKKITYPFRSYWTLK